MSVSDKSDQIALNADVVGYSRLIADDVDATTATMQQYRVIVDEIVISNGGGVPQFFGDNFMAIFDDAKQAVQAAIQISSELEDRNADLPQHRQVRFRMGADQGPITSAAGNLHGDALNIAARIQAIVKPGGLSISGRVYRTLDEPRLRFIPRGAQRLKNIPEPTEVYDFADLPRDRPHEPRAMSLALEAPSVALLPIHAENADASLSAAASVIRSDLLHRLSRVPELTVIDARQEPGGEHGGSAARYILETGVHQFGEQARLYATVFDVTSMNVVKSHKWMVPVTDVVGFSDELAKEVARSVEVELLVGAPAGLYAELGDPEAIEKIYLGWYHLRTDTEEGWRRALDLFVAVEKSHPDHPYGHVLAGFARWIGVANGWGGDAAAMLDEAMARATTAKGLGDPTGMGTMVQAAVQMSQGDIAASSATMDSLEIAQPMCDVTYGLEGSLRRYMGEWEKAVDLIDTAMRLTGINKPWYPTVKACSLFVGGRLEQAVSLAESVLEYQPHNLEALLVLVAAQVELGMHRRAEATAKTISERFPSVDVEAWLERSPFQRREIVERWKGDLMTAGVVNVA